MALEERRLRRFSVRKNCFNPYYSGSGFRSRDDPQHSPVLLHVSILIILEVALEVYVFPCGNGIRSVSILIILEVALEGETLRIGGSWDISFNPYYSGSGFRRAWGLPLDDIY